MLNHLFAIKRSPEPNPTQDVITVEVEQDGIKSNVSINPTTQKIEIHAPIGLTPEALEDWKKKVGTGDKIIAQANKKAMESNRMISDAEKTTQQKLAEAEALRLQWIEKNNQVDAALANLGNAKAQPSNPTTVKQLHEFLGIAADELPDFIANNPAEFSKKQGEYITEITNNAVNGIRQTDQSLQEQQAIKQKALADNIDYTDFVNFCTNMGAKPNDYTMSVYKTFKSGPQPTQQNNSMLDFSKYSIDILPAGVSTTTNWETIRKTPGAVDKLKGPELAQYMAWLNQQTPDG